MTIDEGRVRSYLEVSQDLHSDAMHRLEGELGDVVESGLDARRGGNVEPSPERRRFLRTSVFAAGSLGAGFGALQLMRATRVAYADQSADVGMLQTAAAIENLAIAVYQKAATLDPNVSGAVIPIVKDFVVTTIAQHTDHANAFNAAAQKLGGKPQTAIDKTVFDAVVTPALAKIAGPPDVVALALTLEDAAAQTYVKFGGAVDDANAIKTFATVAPVEAQHAAILRAVQALLAGGLASQISYTPDLSKLPAAAGSVGFPKSFYPVDAARPADEGKVA